MDKARAEPPTTGDYSCRLSRYCEQIPKRKQFKDKCFGSTHGLRKHDPSEKARQLGLHPWHQELHGIACYLCIWESEGWPALPDPVIQSSVDSNPGRWLDGELMRDPESEPQASAKPLPDFLPTETV